jgi:hypothetical protein
MDLAAASGGPFPAMLCGAAGMTIQPDPEDRTSNG